MTAYLLRTLVVQTPGTRLVLEGDSVKALLPDGAPRRLPLTAIDAIVVLSGVDVSTPLLLRCATDGRGLTFLSGLGKARASVVGPQDGRGHLRELQYRRHFDGEARGAMAWSIVTGKIGQMAWGLRQWARDARSEDAVALRMHATRLDELARSPIPGRRESMLGIEGTATHRYFSAMRVALREAEFTTRTRRPPRDPVNAALSFLYGMVAVATHGAALSAGLDPFCGFLHGDRGDQPSLVLDLAEEFRPAADRFVVGLFNRRQMSDRHFTRELGGGVSLSDSGREVILDAWHRHRLGEVKVRGAVEPVPRAALPIVQANALAKALRSYSEYEPHQLVVT
ncbi:CRISPR-associated protein Cas1 [Propionibacteriaceae bacterium ES.041]|uniref:CRISPR-associated endonuclease Cas1 n=1 Tax=Enemella evansiae TaxID=2016499 RepID=UPI000C00BE9D|nr:CRISPR-associated endonuclease Cas1 [Enemella evansiae]PFG66076.1 CRISPR-associated protein Cas1 [Propionibacteriaceae bacterium ES.041]